MTCLHFGGIGWFHLPEANDAFFLTHPIDQYHCAGVHDM